MSLQKAISYSIIAIGLAYLVNQIPLSNFLENYIANQKAELIENILFFTILSFSVFLIIKRFQIPFYFFDKKGFLKLYFYIPVLLYFFIFSGFFRNYPLIDAGFFAKTVNWLYTLEELLSAAFEEILFRGFVFGIMLLSLFNQEKGVLKAVIVSSFLFGMTHIMNLKTFEGNTIGNVLNQIYATFCIGIMWTCVYYKSRSLIVLIIIHFASIFFAGLEPLLTDVVEQINDNTKAAQSTLNMIISSVFKMIIFGLPAVLGLFILSIPSPDDHLTWNHKIKQTLDDRDD